MLDEGDRIQNTFSGLIAKVVAAQSVAADPFTDHYWFAVRFEDEAKAERHYSRNGPDGSFVFTRLSSWRKIDDAPVPMEDTRDYLEAIT